MFWHLLLIVFIVCAILCAVGFYRFVYFLSIGYGFAIAGGSVAVMILSIANSTIKGVMSLLIAQTILFICYGFRLSGFLLYREIKNASYRKTLREATGNDKKLPIFVSLTIWLTVSALYTAQLSPMLFRYANGSTDFIVPVIGLIVSILGLILESAADKQKSAQKKNAPDKVATEGLYKIVRCPNYFGEIVFWTGIFISGITTYANIGQWIMAAIAYICIIYIMFNGATRLEKRQMERYGNDAEYKKYSDSTPIIIPLVPIYHLNKQ